MNSEEAHWWGESNVGSWVQLSPAPDVRNGWVGWGWESDPGSSQQPSFVPFNCSRLRKSMLWASVPPLSYWKNNSHLEDYSYGYFPVCLQWRNQSVNGNGWDGCCYFCVFSIYRHSDGHKYPGKCIFLWPWFYIWDWSTREHVLGSSQCTRIERKYLLITQELRSRMWARQPESWILILQPNQLLLLFV